MKRSDARKYRPALLPLQGSIQHYAWGGYEFIPRLLGIQNKEEKPYAELWIGAHLKSPATVDFSGRRMSLADVIGQAPDEILGLSVSGRFGGQLPYLLKVLDARKMLSIQAHPNQRQAREGFARENAAGIGLHSADRNYRDGNHKPEVQVALSEFWMLHGFRPLDQVARTFTARPELIPVMPDLGRRLNAAGRDASAHRDLLHELYGSVMRMPQARVDAVLSPLIARLTKERPTDKDSPDFWVVRAAESFRLRGGHCDRGIFSFYLLNLLHLQPGQGTFQPAGVLHAYLEGTTMELMASSDNVLRGGLTPKHVDVEELMRTVSFDSEIPALLTGESVSSAETVYRTSAEEFELSRIDVSPGNPHIRKAGHGPDAMIVLEGSTGVISGSGSLLLHCGGVVLAPDCLEYTLESRDGRATVFRASVPKRALNRAPK
jgi:mannose-6-phosphate isomerase